MVDVLSGIVCDYSFKGSPVVKSSHRIVLLGGYSTAHKTPVGEVAQYIISESHKNADIGRVVNELPSSTIGTISGYGYSGDPIMDCQGKIILLGGYIQAPKVGTDVEYRLIMDGLNFSIAWVVDNTDPIGTALEVIRKRCDSLDFTGSREKYDFLETLDNINRNNSDGYPEFSLMNIENIYLTMGSRLRGCKDDINRRNVSNGLKFLKIILDENCSKKLMHSYSK